MENKNKLPLICRQNVRSCKVFQHEHENGCMWCVESTGVSEICKQILQLYCSYRCHDRTRMSYLISDYESASRFSDRFILFCSFLHVDSVLYFRLLLKGSCCFQSLRIDLAVAVNNSYRRAKCHESLKNEKHRHKTTLECERVRKRTKQIR